LLAHQFLPEFDASMYIDNSVLLTAPPERALERYLSVEPMAFFQHSWHKTLGEEFVAVTGAALDDRARVAEQLALYTDKHPDVLVQRPYWTGIIMRRHSHSAVRALGEIWRDHVLRYSRRDQLSFNLCLVETGLTPEIIAEDNKRSWMHAWPHARGRKPRLASGDSADWTTELEAGFKAALALEEARSKLAAKEAEVVALRASTSWRLTAPLRMAVIAGRKGLDLVAAPKSPRLFRRQVAGAAGAPRGLPGGLGESTSDFEREGYIGPRPLFTPEQCKLILRHYEISGVKGSREWPKDLAVKDPVTFDIATRPAILAMLRPLLGEDVVLWGSSIVERVPGQVHLCHTDIESSSPEGGFVSVWIGLAGTTRESSLQLISRSHRFGLPVQKEFHDRKAARAATRNETILGWARERDPKALLIQPAMSDGDALFFDGRLWHGSANSGSRKRTALLLQYARAGTPVPIQEFESSDWPFRMTNKTATVLPVLNRKTDWLFNAAPALPHTKPRMKSVVHPGSGFAAGPSGFVPYHILRGATPNVSEMESHVSVLSPGHSPHPPHRHVEEELLVVLDGEAEIVIPRSADEFEPRIQRLTAGGFVYYPAYQYHTIRNVSSRPVTYLMYKWRAAPKETVGQLRTTILDIGSTREAESAISMPVLLDSPTGYLSRLHAHVTTMKPEAGYEPHEDRHDVAIAVFEGTVETLGKKIGRFGTAFSAAGESHGLRNTGSSNARYLVFEFHA
jgi:ectoine hydroxylase-related dioxygenase (phytanoyl-CoA dioxygenase family)/mannose-6-phosphate isomerase-like protein (cupin superfamily)